MNPLIHHKTDTFPSQRIRESLADYSISPTQAESLFLQRGDYWIIRYHGQTAFLKSTRGLNCLAVLLREPGREFHVTELLARPKAGSTPAGPALPYVTGGLYGGIPLLDGQAKAEYKRRIDQLRNDLEKAERFNDRDRAATDRIEMDAIVQQLAAAVGLGGRDRRASSNAERARSAVTKRIRRAIDRIAEVIPPLGRHLAARIKTGYFCSYNPDPVRLPTWRF